MGLLKKTVAKKAAKKVVKKATTGSAVQVVGNKVIVRGSVKATFRTEAEARAFVAKKYGI